MVDDIFDPAIQTEIRELVRALPPATLEYHEIERFGRHIVHDIQRFLELQALLLPRMSALVGIPLVAAYNFLSLYGGAGRCDSHMDEP